MHIYPLTVKLLEDTTVLHVPFETAVVLRDTVSVETFLTGTSGTAEYTMEKTRIYVNS